MMMSGGTGSMMVGLIMLTAAGVLSGTLAALVLSASEKRLPFLERLPRLKVPALILGYIALLMCVPHALVVAPAFLVPWVLPLAVVTPWLAIFFVDNPTARAIGGLMILAAYEVVHVTFEMRVPGYSLYCAAAWIFGMGGIWLSGFPPLLRDTFRRSARQPYLRCALGGFLTVFALAQFGAVIRLLFR